MTAQKHTPEKWYGTGNGFVRVVGSDQAVASTYGDRDDCMPDDRMMEIERLISAAPEMLDALRIIVANAEVVADPRMNGRTDAYIVSVDDIETAMAAIAKATGQ